MNNNDFTDFLLREYEHIAKAYFSAHELTAKWFKFYLLILASPFSVIAILYYNKSEVFDIFNLSITISLLILLIGLLSMFISFIIINSRLDASLYARAVNGIRKYFTDQLKNKSEEIICKYLVLPTDINKPKFIKFSGDLFILFLIMTITNALYIAHSVAQLTKLSGCVNILLFFIVLFFIIVIHFLYYVFFAKRKEKNYPQKGKILE